MLATVSNEELNGWLAYERAEPSGPLQDDFRAGQICSAVSRTGWGRPHPPDWFFPSLAGPKQPQKPAARPTLRQLREKLLGVFGGRGTPQS